MAEINTGTTYADTVAVPEVDTAPPVEAPQQGAASQTPQATLPPKYAGKGPEELARMLEESERMIGRQAAEVGELRQRASTYEQQFAQFMEQQARQSQTAQSSNTQAPTEPPGAFDWEHPDKSVDSRVERKLRTELDGLRRQVMMENAASQAPIAKNIAKTMYPDAFKSVSDDELDRAMYGGVQAGNVLPQNLTRPEAWRMAAWLLQGEKLGYKMGQSINPVSPTATESPVGARPQSYGGEEQVSLDDQARSILRGFGTDEASYTANRRTEGRGR